MEPNNDRRRYREGLHFHYDFTFASQSRLSKILTEKYEDEFHALLEGREERLQMLEEDLQDLHSAQKRAKQTSFNKGVKYVEDDRSTEKRLTLEARIDVVKWEIEKLKQEIEDAEAVEEELPPCLPRGPEGINSVRGSTGSGFLDGQKVEPVNGRPVIVDERSPYRGMSVIDYTEHVARLWKIACQKHTAEMRKKLDNEGVPRAQQRHRYTVAWPEYPTRCKNHLNGNGRAAEVGGVLVRSKKKVK